MNPRFILALLAVGLSSGPVWAQTNAPPPAPADAPAPATATALAAPAAPAVQPNYTLFNPAPESALRPLCTDRPTKSNGPCTVDPGHLQIEADILDAQIQHSGGIRTETYFMADPTVKLGLTKTVDAEVNIAAIESVAIRTPGGLTNTTATGIGDLYARLKWNFFGVDGGPVSIALSPYVKLPTARLGVGNGATEEGLLVPVQFNLANSWTLAFNGEVDALKDQNDSGRHANYLGIVSLSHPLTKTLTGTVELWNDLNDDPSGSVRQRSFDLALAWVPMAMPNVQFDGGLNFGLNDGTPRVQVYAGVSRRF